MHPCPRSRHHYSRKIAGTPGVGGGREHIELYPETGTVGKSGDDPAQPRGGRVHSQVLGCSGEGWDLCVGVGGEQEARLGQVQLDACCSEETSDVLQRWIRGATPVQGPESGTGRATDQ